MAARLTEEIFAALAEQTTVVTGTSAAEHMAGRLAVQLQQPTQQHADIAPVTRQTATSIRGEIPSRRVNTILKRVLFLSAFASVKSDQASGAYYDKKRTEGKRHD